MATKRPRTSFASTYAYGIGFSAHCGSAAMDANASGESGQPQEEKNGPRSRCTAWEKATAYSDARVCVSHEVFDGSGW